MSFIIFVVGLLASSSVQGYRLQTSDSSALQLLSQKLNQPEVSMCDICVDGLEEVKSLMTSDEIEKLINDVSDKMCKVLPAAMAEKCITMVDDVIQESFMILRDLLDTFGPKTICQMITLCPKTAETPEFFGGNGKCEICTDGVATIRKIITDPALEQLIKDNLEFPCQFFWPFGSECKSMVEASVVQVFSRLRMLFDGYQNEDICKIAHMCSAAPSEMATFAMSHTTLCDVCVDSLEEAKSVLTNPEIEKLTEDIVYFWCSLIPTEALSGTCKETIADMVQEYFWMARDFLEMFTPRDMCETIYLCSAYAPKAEEFLALVTAPKDDHAPVGLCEICEDSIAVARSLSLSPELQRAIITDSKFPCIFTGPFRSYCERQVETIVTYVFIQARSIVSNIDDHTVCVTFDFCSDGSKTSVCDVCKNSYEVSKQFLVSESLKNFIESNTKFGCRAFGPMRIICEDIVLGVANEFFAIVHREMDSMDGQAFCNKIWMCSSKQEFYAAVGLNKGLCEVCKHSIETVEEQITSGHLERIAGDLGKLSCKFMTGEYRTKCENMVVEIAHSTFDVIKDAFDLYTSDELCHTFWMC